jgi:hypothetical protein
MALHIPVCEILDGIDGGGVHVTGCSLIPAGWCGISHSFQTLSASTMNLKSPHPSTQFQPLLLALCLGGPFFGQ